MQEFQRYFAERYMQPFYGSLYPNTEAVQEFSQRGFSHSFAWVKSRMVDDVKAMADQWRQERDNGKVLFPICLMAIRRDFTPSDPSFARPIADAQSVMSPNGSGIVKMQTSTQERTVQVVFLGASEADTRSLATQMCLHAAKITNRRFYSDYDIAGDIQPFPCSLENSALVPESVESDQKNISIHKIDLMFHETTPFVGRSVGVVEQVNHEETYTS